MPAREAEISPELELDLAAPDIAKRTVEMVERERQRGWAFKNEAGRYRRQDVFDRLLAKDQITDLQHQAGKRYQRQFSAAFEYGRCVSTLEFRRSDQALSDGGVQQALYLGRTYREALGGHPRLAGVMAQACGLAIEVADLVALRAALSRLVNYYADLEDESEELEAPPERRTLLDRGADILANWCSFHATANRRAGPLLADLRRVLWEAQNKRCACCGVALPDPVGAQVEHVWATSRGGFDGPGNLTLAHPSCNRRKGAANPKRYQLEVLKSVNELLGWAKAEDEPTPEERIAAAFGRLANPGVAPVIRPRIVHLAKEETAAQPVGHLEKPSRAGNRMHEKWLASQGVVKSNRSMRARGVNAASRRK